MNQSRETTRLSTFFATRMLLSLAGETVPQAGTPGRANCHGKSVSALAHQFRDIDAAASALGFSSVEVLQDAFRESCER